MKQKKKQKKIKKICIKKSNINVREILRLKPSPQARFIPSPSPTSPTPSHDLISFLITLNGEKNHQNLKTLTIQGEN